MVQFVLSSSRSIDLPINAALADKRRDDSLSATEVAYRKSLYSCKRLTTAGELRTRLHFKSLVSQRNRVWLKFEYY